VGKLRAAQEGFVQKAVWILMALVVAVIAFLFAISSGRNPPERKAETPAAMESPVTVTPTVAAPSGTPKVSENLPFVATDSARIFVRSQVLDDGGRYPEYSAVLNAIEPLLDLGPARTLADDYFLAVAAARCLSVARAVWEQIPASNAPGVDYSQCLLIPQQLHDFDWRLQRITAAAEAGYLPAMEMYGEAFGNDLFRYMRDPELLLHLKQQHERFLWQALARGSETALNNLAFGYADGAALQQNLVYAAAAAHAQSALGRLDDASLQRQLQRWDLSERQRRSALSLSVQIVDRYRAGGGR